MSSNQKLCTAPAAAATLTDSDFNECGDIVTSSSDDREERFTVIPIAEMGLSYCALNSPEMLYLDATNQILLRCINGVTMIYDATFENTSPVASYRLNPNARMTYNKHSGVLAVADSKMLCLRQDYGGTFLLKTILKRPSAKNVSVELPADEAAKFLQIAMNDPDSEDILKQRPLLRKFISALHMAVNHLPANSMESVVVEVNGEDLLQQLRPLETPGDTNNAEVPLEWMTFIWPYISILGERVRLMLNPDQPYDFNYAPEWKGLNKEIMASEAARLLTFKHWPHMDYRWALPCQMAEAGFYHQPNNAGDDRVLCFACFVCLVSWEPSDEPWSEHERHSPKCRFVHNYTSPNVPLALTMSALSPFAHHLQLNHTSSLVFSTGNSEWLAIASRECAEIHLWRTDSVVQVKQWFSLISEKFFMAIVDCLVEENQQPRKTQRVTWSDSITKCLMIKDGEQNMHETNNVKGFPSMDNCLLKRALAAILLDASCETVITALSTVGRPFLIEQSSIGAVTKKPSEQNETLVVVGVSVNDVKLNKVRLQSQNNFETEVNTLNTMNAACELIDAPPPRIVDETHTADDASNGSKTSLLPFLALYQLDYAESISSRRQTSVGLENEDSTENNIAQSSDLEDFSEGALSMDTDSAVLDWSGVTYSENPDLADNINESSDEVNELWNGATKTDAKFDEKANYMPVKYETSPMDISFVQCFRLPSPIDNPSMEISAIIPMQSIFLVVVVNNKEPTCNAIQSAILIYLIHFGKITITLQKEPLKAYYYKEFRIIHFSLANMDLENSSRSSLNSEFSTNDYFDGAVIRTMEDTVYFINLNTNKLYSLCDEKVAQFAVMDAGKVALLTRNSGKLITVQVEQSSSRDTNYDDDVTISGLLSKTSDSQVLKGNEVEERILKNIPSVNISSAKLLSSGHLLTPALRRLWKLTRSDVGGPIRGPSHRPSNHLGGQLGYQLTPPPGWCEVPMNQRVRKYHIESLPVDGVSGTLFYQSDSRRHSGTHIFELIHNQHGLRISHVNVCLNFHETCLACPDIELRLYRRKIDASGATMPSKSSLCGNSNLKEVEAQCEMMAGPYRCVDYADLNGRCAKIQLPGIIFMPQLIKKGNRRVGFKPVSYYIVLRAMSDFSFDQTVTALKMNERNKIKIRNTPGKAKSPAKRRISDSELADTSQSSVTENGDILAPGLDSRRGMQWVNEVMIMVVKAKRIVEPCDRIERRALIETTELHNTLIMLAAGILPGTSPTQKARSVGEKLQQQNLAIGIIEWLIDNWVDTSAQKNISTLAEMMMENVDAIFTNCFVISSRTISHKWCTILIYMMRILKKIDDGTFLKLLRIFLSCSIRIVINLHAVRNSGSLHWLFLFIFTLLKMAIMRTNDFSCGELVNALLEACANTLTSVGIAWKQCWNGSLHEKLANEYGLSGLPMELVIYDWPASVLSLFPQATSTVSKYFDPNEFSQPAVFPPATPTMIAHKIASASAGYGKGLSETKTGQHFGVFRQEKVSPSVPLTREGVDVNTYINGLTVEDELDWLTLFNISSDASKDISENISEVPSSQVMYPSTPDTEMMIGRLSSYSGPFSQRECKFRVITTSTQLSGLLETEPLNFTIICASDHLKVENMDTGVITEVSSTSAPLGHAENDGPLPLKIMDVSSTGSNKLVSNIENGSTASKLGFKDLSADLNARMTLIAVEQALTKEDKAVRTSEQNSQTLGGNVEQVVQGSTTQGSSASTFGIPTTPKTTPFMTPTPLSPSHLSPINSEANLDYMMENDVVENETSGAAEKPQKNENERNEMSQIPTLTPMISSDIFKLPSQKILLLERITFGSRKFVILDFGIPVLLTDFFIPSIAEIAAISIDVWLLGENVDGQRLFTTTDISSRSIAVQDLEPFMRIRFVKITYVGRQLYNTTCKIPLGLFFGHRYYSSWQLYSSPCMQKEFFGHCLPTNQFQQKQIAVTVSHLRQLCEDLRCRHQLASAELNRLVDEFASEEEVKQVYRDCVHLSLQWNIVVGVVHRLELDQLPSRDSNPCLEKILSGNWNDCCPDQLRTVAVELFSLLIRATHLLDVRAVALETFANDDGGAAQSCCPSGAKHARIKTKESMVQVNNASVLSAEEIVLQQKFSLDDAVTHFLLFCVPAVPRLQVGCVTWLFHHGSESDWWPSFFPRVLKEIFSTQLKKHDHKTFLLLSFLCNHSVKSSSKQAAIILELFNLIRQTASTALDNYGHEHIQNKFDVTLLCWSLMLLSSAFDVITYSKRKNDRWGFLGGECSQALWPSDKDDSSPKWHRKKGPLSAVKFDSSNSKGSGATVKCVGTTALKTQLESLWEQHLNVMKAMKANMKMSEALNAKLHKKVEIEKKLHQLSSDVAKNVNPSEVNEMELSDLSDELYATMFPVLNEEQIEEVSAKKYFQQQSADSKIFFDATECGLKKAISFSATTSKNNSRSSRPKQCNVRLKLPHEPCIEVARKLIRLLCDYEKRIPILAKLIMCKIVARICISASHHTIPLVCVLEGPIDKLIKIGLEEQRTGLLKYAVLHLILDLTEAESRAKYASSKNQLNSKEKDTRITVATEELDMLCMRLTGSHFADIARHAKSRNEMAADIKARKSSGMTAAVSCLPEAFCIAKTSENFSIANYDQQPELESESLDILIQQALLNTRQAVVPSGPVDEIRSTTYQKKAKEIIKEKLASGEQFCYVFRWIDDLLKLDEYAACSCNGDPKLYQKLMETEVLPAVPYEERTEVSNSAFVACCLSEYTCYMSDKKSGVPVRLPVIEAGSSSPSAAELQMPRTVDVEMKTADIDETMRVMENIDSFADCVSQKITEVAAYAAECDQCEAQLCLESTKPVTDAFMEMEPCYSNSSAFSESRIRKNLGKWVPAKWISKIALNKDAYMEHVMANFLAELRLARNDILIQPCSFTCIDPMIQQSGLNQIVYCMNMDFLSDAIARYSIRDLSRWRIRLLSRPRLTEDETMRGQLGETLNATSAALGRFVQSISSTDSNESVQRLLTFCLDFQAGLASSTKKLPTAGKCMLPISCVDSIIEFAVMSNSISEQLWTLVLRVLDLIVRNNPSASTPLIESPHFCQLISKFLIKSIVRVNKTLATGPATVNAFKSFIALLHENRFICLRSMLCTKILTVLTDISIERDDLINFSYPIDCLVELLNIMADHSHDYGNIELELLAKYISSAIHTAHKFIRDYKAFAGYTLVSADSYLRPNACFQVVQKMPENMQFGFENGNVSSFPHIPEIWGQYEEQYSHSLSQVVDARQSMAFKDPSARFPVLSPRHHQSNIFRQIAGYLDNSKKLADQLVSSFPKAVEELFEIVASCESAVPDISLISLENWNRVTLGDHALSILLQISQQVSSEVTNLFKVAIQVIMRYASPSNNSLSKPFAFAVVQMLCSRNNQICFAAEGGHLLVARELEHSILASTNDWTAPISAALMRQLASLSAQVAGTSDSRSSASKLPPDGRVDGLYNFAPLCAISSEEAPSVAGQMLSLISVAAPRRTRSANWSYHFGEGGGEWFDIVLTLPYHIILHEVQIRPHVPALSTSPEAVQVELCSETSLSQWCNLGAPLSIAGYNKIRISTLSYKLPVIAVRLYLKKPPDSPNLALSQILLLGTSFTTSLSDTCPKNTDFVQWLSIMVQICKLENQCIWEYAPKLPQAVIALFLGRPLSSLVYYRISQLLYQIDDERAKPYSVVELIFHYIGQGNNVTNESLEWLPDLLYNLCAQSPSVDVEKGHQICITKQCQMLFGVSSVIISQNYKKPLRNVVAVLVWTASCIIWYNINVEERRCSTVALCMDLTPRLLPFLCQMAVDTSEQCNDTSAKSASWLLCSLIRAAPCLLSDALKELGLMDYNDKPKTEGISPSAFTVVQRMCQSASSVSQLHFFGLLQHWTEMIIRYCQEKTASEGNMEHMSLMVSMVRCLASLCCIEDVVKFLDFACGARLFSALIRCVVRCAAEPGDMTRACSKQSIKLEEAAISLLSQCVTVGGAHRLRIAHVLCSLLKNAGGLNGAIQQMVLKCIFDDETIPVKAFDEDTPVCYLAFDIPNRILHPYFGCTRRERYLKVSLYTSMDDMSALFEHKSTCDFRQLARVAVPNDDHRFSSVMYDRGVIGFEEFHRNIAVQDFPSDHAYLRSDVTTASPLFNSSRLVVKSGDGSVEMKGEWKIGQLLGDLLASGRLTSSARKQRASGQANTGMVIEDGADGYYTVTLSFSQRSDVAASKSMLSEKLNVTLTEQTSTLQYFARASGLALLAQHLQLYYPTFNSSITSFSPSGAKRKSPAQQFLETSEAMPMTEMTSPAPFACQATVFPPPDLLNALCAASVYSSEIDIYPGYEDFEFIDAVPVGEGKPFAYCPVLSQIDTFGNQVQKTLKNGSQLPASPRASSVGLSTHVVIAFSTFLRLDGYAELLVTYDRKRAKSLLRLAMGVVSPETASIMSKERLLKPGLFRRFAISPQPQSHSEQKSECENLGVLPFIVLEELFSKYTPDTAAGKSLREAAITYGVLDILLSCLAHYSHQKHREESIRPPDLIPAPETAALIERLLRPSVKPELNECHSINFGSTREKRTKNIENTMISTSYSAGGSNAPQQLFWAKGTGFGSGTTQQQWNVDLHVMKRRQDEQNVTHLLRVLSNFIYPRINEYLKKNKNGTATDFENSTTSSQSVSNSRIVEAHSQNSPVLSFTSVLDTSMSICSTVEEPILPVTSVTPQWSLNSAVVKMLSRSCLFPAVWAYLRNDSVLDISQHVEVYEAVLQMVAALALSPTLSDGEGEGEDEITTLLSEPESGCSMQMMLKKLFECVSAYLTRLTFESNETRLQNLNIQQTEGISQESSQAREEGLMRLAPLITTTCSILCKRVKETLMNSGDDEKSVVTEEENYIKVMKNLQFETISFFNKGAFIPYHYESSLSSVGASTSLGKRTRRLAQEIVTLSNSLPLSASSSVFVRACEERLDVMKVLITGPADTPYMNGCFEFDVWFPTDYPNSPMHVNLETTGSHTVRFNPNLYNDGKVCLSVLNTWHGRPEERWNPETSSLLQVIVSVQSLILVAEPYFNEPGYERSKCTQAGQQASRDYDANIRQAVVKWAMLEMLRHPPPAFADVIRKHFWLKRAEISSQISKWISEMEQLVKQHRVGGRSMHAHLASLKRNAAALEEEFRQMKCPIDLKESEVVVHNQATSGNAQQMDTSVHQLSNAANASGQITPPCSSGDLSTMKILKL